MSFPTTLELSSCGTLPLVSAGVLVYLCVVRALRRGRFNAVHKRYAAKWEAKTRTVDEAQEIMKLGTTYDMPFLLEYALSFALFKTYAIPTISKLLYDTRQLGSDENVARRFADTGLLISTWMACPLSGQALGKESENDPRASLALARVNWLHSKYNISNGDYLYTLALFILEPITWAKRYGWRELSPLEQYATFIFWAEVGRKMNIKDIPESLEDLMAWTEAYEKEFMVPAQTNHDVARCTTGELLFTVPHAFGLRRFLEGFSRALLEDRVRIAMMEPEAPRYATSIVPFLLNLSAFIQKHLLLPRSRPSDLIQVDLPKASPIAPRMFVSKPWYKPRRRGLGSLLDRAFVWIGWHSDVPGPEYRSDGYRIHELGPLRYEKEGHEKVFSMAAQMQGCPVADAWKAEKKEK
ncbi:hypothetical protein FB45DRAFT_753621 [Roridomyces roridus]|uniref:ER-bound oxygenase mpaB/mpaB'/Rubber oxygenase catalytic domain-containing protein n=1 Tax=Roridomyces roridus TaxID=1738132 RepID=A0AAD7FIL8_9AGAR|nr:hypothetical protein FB45DRAFT_753621 [Roridomyces roridus]